jgi:hypothetical protein
MFLMSSSYHVLVQDGRLRVIAYGSRTLNKTEKNYCITDKELLAVRYFIQYYRQYLLGRTFTVRTDHQALIWLFSLKEPKGRKAKEPNQCLVICSDSKSSAQQVLSIVLYKISYC